MRRSVTPPDFDRIHRGFEEDISHSLFAALQEAGLLYQADLRNAVEEAGLGSRLARTWRLKVYPSNGRSMDPAAWVWTKAPGLIEVFETGVTIRARNGKWLAVPTPAAGRSGTRGSNGRYSRLTPAEFERRSGLKLRLIYRPGRRASFLVADNARLNTGGNATRNTGRSRAGGEYTRLQGRTTVIVFLLLPQVHLRKRLNNEALWERAQARVPGLISKHWR